MSFSFNVKGATKLDAIEAANKQLDDVAAAQPVHTTDKYQVYHAMSTFVSLLAQDDTKDVHVTVSGSIYKPEAGVQQISCNVTAQLVARG